MDDNDNRLYLHGLLKSIFPDLEVYYQISGQIKVARPCIIYQKKALEPAFANNAPYTIGVRFQIMFLSDLPGYENVRKIFDLSSYGISVSSGADYIQQDIVHNVFIASVGTL